MKIKGLKNIVSDLKNNNGYFQINYDPATGNAWSDYVATPNNWEEYHDTNIISIRNVKGYHSMEELRQMIEARMTYEA